MNTNLDHNLIHPDGLLLGNLLQNSDSLVTIADSLGISVLDIGDRLATCDVARVLRTIAEVSALREQTVAAEARTVALHTLTRLACCSRNDKVAYQAAAAILRSSPKGEVPRPLRDKAEEALPSPPLSTAQSPLPPVLAQAELPPIRTEGRQPSADHPQPPIPIPIPTPDPIPGPADIPDHPAILARIPFPQHPDHPGSAPGRTSSRPHRNEAG